MRNYFLRQFLFEKFWFEKDLMTWFFINFQASFPIAAIIISFLSINYKLFNKADTASEHIDLHIDRITPSDAEILIWLDESLKDRTNLQDSLIKVIENENLRPKYLTYPRNLIEDGKEFSERIIFFDEFFFLTGFGYFFLKNTIQKFEVGTFLSRNMMFFNLFSFFNRFFFSQNCYFWSAITRRIITNIFQPLWLFIVTKIRGRLI